MNSLEAKIRDNKTKGQLNSIRNNGGVPAIIYGGKDQNQKVVFISGHFSNFELMAMQIDKIGIKIGAIYRPLNNFFLNPFMVCLLYTSPSPRDS